MRKFIFVFTLFLFAGISVNAQTTAAAHSDYTFNFYQGTFEQALKEAAKQKKLVFVDAFTSWCGPCKMMTKNTFTDKAAGDFFNSKFISMKIDMEKDNGPAFAMKYGVTAYPTLFFINSKGEVVHKVLGYRDAVALMEEAKKSLALAK